MTVIYLSIKMKRLIATPLFFLLTALSAYCQQSDTLRVLVLAPNKVEVSKDCKAEYEARNNVLVKNRVLAAAAKRKQKESNQEQYSQQPEYTRKMFENDIAFVDSLTLSNYVSYIARDFIAYRLYKPHKIKPRLILVTTEKLPSNLTAYAVMAAKTKADFILNFPLLVARKSKQGLQVTTSTELYSSKQKTTIVKEQSVGTIEGNGPTDYPMCERGELECAFVNSVYENIYKCVLLIAESRK